ncbi:facilitated trehalose transporter Tret1-2 homolog isoform X1 [Palaemon carinicauda]|uniref:facilitated trehalose transporter Tret1-2 homolog isoform X1 n=1 Tax=Palaemon carinicauda TaxID=392227 RepID=UPI0035B66CFB
METTDEKSAIAKETTNARRIRYAKQCLIVLSASLTNIPSGMIQLWPNVLASHLVRDNSTIFGSQIQLDPWQMDLVASVTQIGSLVGFLSAGVFLSLVGRKYSLIITAIPGIFGSSLIALSVNTYMIVIGRFLDGMTVGMGNVAVFVYASEISDVSIRGTLCMISHLLIQVGGIFNLCLGTILSWYYMSIISVGLLLGHCLMVSTLHESPSFLAVKSRDERALRVLRKLRAPQADVQEELCYLQKNNTTSGDSQGYRGLLQKQHLKQIALMTGIFFIHNFCGTQVLRVNATRQLQQLGLPMNEKYTTIMVIGVFFFGNLFMTTILDCCGRRRCIMASLLVLTVAYSSLGTFVYLLNTDPSLIEPQKYELLKFAYSVQNATLSDAITDGSAIISIKDWLPLVLLMVAAFGHSMGIGPLVWILPAEMFPTNLRSQGTSVCMVIGSLMMFAILQVYSPMQATLTQAGMYWFFASVSATGILYIYCLLKETSGERVG